MNPQLEFKCRVFQHWIWPCNWPSTTISHFHSTMLQASRCRLKCLQQTRASCQRRVAQRPRGKAPKIKVLHPRINILGLKNLCLPALALSVAKKATEPQTAGRKVNCSLCLHLQAKPAPKMRSQFPNRETDHAKGYLWMLSRF